MSGENIEDRLICITCGNIFVKDDYFDCLGSESGICCPDCGNEKFVTVKKIIENHDSLVKALRDLLAFIEPRLNAEGGIVGCREDELCCACKAKKILAKIEKEKG